MVEWFQVHDMKCTELLREEHSVYMLTISYSKHSTHTNLFPYIHSTPSPQKQLYNLFVNLILSCIQAQTCL